MEGKISYTKKSQCFLFIFGTLCLLALYPWATHPEPEFLHLTNEDLLPKRDNEHQALSLVLGTQKCSRGAIIIIVYDDDDDDCNY